jgi:hypothetical protein
MKNNLTNQGIGRSKLRLIEALTAPHESEQGVNFKTQIEEHL